MFYENYYWGMNLVWWLVWLVLLFWIFATPFDIPGQRGNKISPPDILKKRLAAGEISIEEYYATLKIIEKK